MAASYQEAFLRSIAEGMDAIQSPLPATPGEPGSHLQFQISLLRLMNQKWPIPDQQWADRKMTGKKTGSQAGAPDQSPSAQVRELEQLHNSGTAKVRLKTRS